MKSESLRVEHQRIEALLDAIGDDLRRFDADSVAGLRPHVDEACRLVTIHFDGEEAGFHARVRKDFPELSAKME